jgi:hypothetical protein
VRCADLEAHLDEKLARIYSTLGVNHQEALRAGDDPLEGLALLGSQRAVRLAQQGLCHFQDEINMRSQQIAGHDESK